MSKEASDALSKARLKALYAQRTCADCGLRFASADELIDHRLEEHTTGK